MKRFLVTPLVILGLVGLLVPYSYAGNATNSSSTGNATAVILCKNTEPAISVEHSHIAVNTDTCDCDSYDGENFAVACGADYSDDQNIILDSCTGCLANLQRGGLTVVSANAYIEEDAGGSTGNELMHYLLTGNGGPLVTRFGCFCD